MARFRSMLSFARMTALVCAGAVVFGGTPGFRGGAVAHGGAAGSVRLGGSTGAFRSGGGYRGGIRSYGGGFRAYGAPGVRVSAHWGPSYRVLPAGYARYQFRGTPWFCGGGHWYRPWGGGYAAFYPPIGLCLSVLPVGYAMYTFGGVPYYYYENVYYTDAPSGGYVVADPPAGMEEQLGAAPGPALAPPPAPARRGNIDAAALDAVLIIPKEGQSEEKMVTDRSNAQSFAMGKSGYDPTNSDPSDPGTARARQAYLRALRSYLEARGYSVK